MLRFYYVILISIPFIIFYLMVAEHYVRNRERYDEEQCYELAQKVVVRFKKNARIQTISYGEEHLPQDIEVLATYIREVLGGRNGRAYQSSEGRITIN